MVEELLKLETIASYSRIILLYRYLKFLFLIYFYFTKEKAV